MLRYREEVIMGNWINNGEMWAAYATLIGTVVLIFQILMMRQQKSGEDLMLLESHFRYIVSFLEMHVNLLEKMKDSESERSKFYKSYSQEHRIEDSFYQIVKETTEIAYKNKQSHNSRDVEVFTLFLTNATEMANIINTGYAEIGACDESEKDAMIASLSISLRKAYNAANENFTLFDEKIIHLKRRNFINRLERTLLYIFIMLFTIALAIPIVMFFYSLIASLV